ncbi:TatD family hydrolase [Paenibacillus crassostreae]|uniref:DNAase n=1 Tax=Paenibacillus crassostreae TaxID=1763538 RepID=A0A162KQX3_9BACL|nr:TatD family hydrolase [Paenibacillus crassostreae]AOZ92504.1 DNAase [Paenibacillus crassostreae]OAB72453.1 DNAase [Paenibacillus crassostreae]
MNISTNTPFIDAHIHLDSYGEQQPLHLGELPNHGVSNVIAVSMNLQSSKRNLELAKLYPSIVHPAFGFHPEQSLPTSEEVQELLTWMELHLQDMIAVGEVGLPYYSQLEAKELQQPFDPAPYVDLLEQFISFAAAYHKPIILHAVYDDAKIACKLLEDYGVTRAHFHWFKGSRNTIERMSNNGYYISFTPDLLYEPEIQELARIYPKDQVMVETDGPWPFEGPFAGQMTHPRMVSDVIEAWSHIQQISVAEARETIYRNTTRFYGI